MDAINSNKKWFFFKKNKKRCIDILKTLSRRYPYAKVYVYPSDVQGSAAVPMLRAALIQANQERQVDVIILARGGGSIEDLWAFNDESLAIEIMQSTIPIITGIGHETDYTIADFVADCRAATPTAAAEMATPDRYAIANHLRSIQNRLIQTIKSMVLQRQHQLVTVEKCLEAQSPKGRLATARMQVHALQEKYIRVMLWKVVAYDHRLKLAIQGLQNLNPYATLERGYAIAMKADHVLYNTDHVSVGDAVSLRLAHGRLLCHVDEVLDAE